MRKDLTHDLGAENLLQLPKARTVVNGYSILFRGSILWSAIRDEVESSQSIIIYYYFQSAEVWTNLGTLYLKYDKIKVSCKYYICWKYLA